MTFKSLIASTPLVRPAVIWLLSKTKRDITVKNPWTSDPLFLNSFHHKGYWYQGAQREYDTMHFFKKCIAPGNTILEVGGHIGFISQYFSTLVGENGKVVVFEPGRNNLPYIKRNTRQQQNIVVEEMAISDHVGSATFYEDNISGQNNSLLADYKNADIVAASHSMTLEKTKNTVAVTTIDHYVETHNLNVDFLKIDVEGGELDALHGATETLKRVKGLMVEVTENHEAMFNLLVSAGFQLFNDRGQLLSKQLVTGNIFALRA